MRKIDGYFIIEEDRLIRRKARRSLMRETNTGLGICEQLRFIYDSVYVLPKSPIKAQIIEQLIDAMIMAKKMGDRLVYYKKTYKDTTGHAGINIYKLPHSRKRWKMRRDRP